MLCYLYNEPWMVGLVSQPLSYVACVRALRFCRGCIYVLRNYSPGGDKMPPSQRPIIYYVCIHRKTLVFGADAPNIKCATYKGTYNPIPVFLALMLTLLLRTWTTTTTTCSSICRLCLGIFVPGRAILVHTVDLAVVVKMAGR